MALPELKIFNPAEIDAQIQREKSAQMQNKLAELMLGQKQQEITDQNAIRSLLSGAGGDKKAATKSLYGAGYYKQAQEMEKAQLEQDKSVADMDKTKFETASKKLGIMGQAFGYVRNNPTLEAAHSTLDYLGSQGILSGEQVAQYKQQTAANPAAIKQLADQAYMSVLSAEKQLPTYQTRNTGATTDTLSINPVTGKVEVANSVRNTMSPDAAASNAVAWTNVGLRKQEIAQKERELQSGGKAPAGYRWKQDGTLEAIPGGPGAKDKAPTEFQGKSAGFGARAQAADKIISELGDKYSPTAINTKQGLGQVWGVGGALEAGANLFLGDNTQKAEQAQRDFINAVLRQESGAAIADSEFSNAKKQYFPQPGDSKAVIAQKAQNRKLAIQGFLNNAGPASNGIQSQKVDSTANPFAGWSIQEVK